MTFTSEDSFILYKAKSGYRKLVGKNNKTFMYRIFEARERVAVYSWNNITKQVDQLVMPFDVWEALSQEIKGE